VALIKCPECGREISDQASSCPNCGCPIKTTLLKSKATTIEKTGKQWKGIQLACGFVLVFGILLWYSAPEKYKFIGSLIMFGSLVGMIIAWIGAWWEHG